MTREEMIKDLNTKLSEEQRNNYDAREIFDYLDGLRRSGVTNMFGAGIYIREMFNVKGTVSTKLLLGWMDSFGK